MMPRFVKFLNIANREIYINPFWVTEVAQAEAQAEAHRVAQASGVDPTGNLVPITMIRQNMELPTVIYVYGHVEAVVKALTEPE
jgi:hypothetical protein